LKLGKFGAFIGCSNYPECRFTRTLSPPTGDAVEGQRPGVRVLGQDPDSGAEITLRGGRFGDYVQEGEATEEGEKPKRSSIPKSIKPDELTLEQAIRLLSLPREVAKHPESGEPIIAGIGRFGPYVQHGKTYANLGRDDDILSIGGNRAIDLIVTKESGGGGSRFGRASDPGRALGDHPQGGAVSVKKGRFGPYVNWGKVNATLAKGTDPEGLTLEQAVELLAAKASGAPSGGGRVLGEHPQGGAITLRDGRYGPYVNLGKVNATLPKNMSPEDVTLDEAIRLIEEKGGPVKAKKAPAKKAPVKKAAPAAKAPAKKAAAKKEIADSDEVPFEDSKPAKTAAAPAKKPAAAKAKPASKSASKPTKKAAAGK
jgi:DNA topoisomerase-1